MGNFLSLLGHLAWVMKGIKEPTVVGKVDEPRSWRYACTDSSSADAEDKGGGEQQVENQQSKTIHLVSDKHASNPSSLDSYRKQGCNTVWMCFKAAAWK